MAINKEQNYKVSSQRTAIYRFFCRWNIYEHIVAICLQT
jgi:hypothetical protein